MKKKLSAFLIAFILVCLSVIPGFAHPGGLDKKGGHNGPGGYHYHNAGGSGGGASGEDVDALAGFRLTDIAIRELAEEVFVGDEFLMVCEYTPENAYPVLITWESSDESVIQAASDGNFVAVGKGVATITAKELTYEKEDSIEVEVFEVPVEALTLAVPDQEIRAEGENIRIQCVLTPSNATGSALVWTVSDEEIATIANGILTPLKPGKVVIIAASDNGITDSIEVEVLKKKSTALQTLAGLVIIAAIVALVIWLRKRKKSK